MISHACSLFHGVFSSQVAQVVPLLSTAFAQSAGQTFVFQRPILRLVHVLGGSTSQDRKHWFTMAYLANPPHCRWPRYDILYCTIFCNFHERTHFDTHEQLYAMVLDMDFPSGCFQKPKDGTAGRKCHGTGVAKKSDFGMKTFRSHSEAWGNKSPNQKKLINID